MNIIITGVKGFLSNNIKDELISRGYNVDAVSVKNGIDNINFNGCNVIIHCAAIVHKKEKKVGFELYNEVNYKLTVKLAKKARNKGVERFVFISSMSVYGSTSGKIDKNTEAIPKSYYGITKLKAEKELLKMADEKFIVDIIRPPMVYGRGCPGNYNSLSKLAKIAPIFPRVENKRSMIYIKNLTYFIYQLLMNENGGIYMPQDYEYVNTSDMVKRIAEYNGRKVFFSTFIGKLVQDINIPILKKVFGSLYYDVSIADRVKYIDFDTAIKETENL